VDFPIYSLVGGKWTTFRALAEQVADELLRVLGRPRVRGSADVAIGGGKGYPRMPEGTGLPQERLKALLERYGTGAEKVAAYMTAGADSPLECYAAYSRREIEFMALNERVVHLDDVVLRRTLMGLLGQATRPLLEELAAVMAPVLGWSRADADSEVERTVQLLERVHGVREAALSKSSRR
jgi:glycerol-3-phosphate dehydrogenase